MEEVTFTGCQRGSLFTVSPSGSFVAFVRGSLQLVVVHADQSLGACDPLLESAAAVGYSGDKASQKSGGSAAKAEGPSSSFVYKALDAVTSLQWSPDSKLMMLVLQERAAIEIVSVADRVSVARIDCGLNGVQAAMWHPSSTVVYYFGLCRAEVVSLVDGSTMHLDFGVKLEPDTSGNMSELPNVVERLARVGSISQRGQSRALPCWTPLLAFTPPTCSSFYTISPRTAPAAFSGGVGATATTSPLPPITDAADKDESLNQFSSTTHDVILRVPLSKLGLAHICLLRPLQGCVCLGSSLLQSLYIIASDGSHVLHRIDEPHRRVQSIAVCPRAIVAVTETQCLTFALAHDAASGRGSVEEMSPIGISPNQLPLDMTVLTESSVTERRDLIGDNEDESRRSAGRSDEGERVSVYTTESPPKSGGWLQSFSAKYSSSNVLCLPLDEEEYQQRTAAQRCPIYRCAVSQRGKFVAVAQARFPSTVVVCDVLQNSVRTVLRHDCAVASLNFVRSVASSSATSKSSNSAAEDEEEILLISTENCRGTYFVWSEAFASCVTVPRQLYAPVVQQCVQDTYGGGTGSSINTSRSPTIAGSNGLRRIIVSSGGNNNSTSTLSAVSSNVTLAPKVRHAAAFTAGHVGCTLSRVEAVAIRAPQRQQAGLSSPTLSHSSTRAIRVILIDERRSFAIAANMS